MRIFECIRILKPIVYLIAGRIALLQTLLFTLDRKLSGKIYLKAVRTGDPFFIPGRIVLRRAHGLDSFFDVREALFLFAGLEHDLKSPLPASPVCDRKWVRVYAAIRGGAPC